MLDARRFLIALVLGAIFVAGCGDDGSADGNAESGAEASGDDGDTGDTGDDGDDGTSGEGEAVDLDFCEAVAALEVSFEEDEPALAAALEADTPAGLEDAVAVVREYTDRRQNGEDVFQDPDFLLTYDGAVSDLTDHCGLP